MEKEIIQLNEVDLLISTVQKMNDFGDEKNLLLKKEFFDISENENFDKKIRDLAIELILYCEGDELNEFKIVSKEEVLKKIKTKHTQNKQI